MFKPRHFAPLLTLLPFLCGHAWAQIATEETPAATEENREITIDTQRLEIQLDRELHAIGDAELHHGNQSISADRIDFDQINNELHAIGNTRIEQDGNIFTGPELRLKIEEREGEMKEPVFHLNAAPKHSDSSPAPDQRKAKPPEFARGDAKTLLFEGPSKERLKDIRYTTCPEGNDDWYMGAKELELDHYAETGTATHAWINFKGVPILYTPWIDFPFKNQRKSGFLTPTFGTTSRSGVEFMLPYYWNIAPNMDATLSPRYLGKRGLQLNGEFRYLDTDFSGNDTIQYLPNDNDNGRNRYFAQIKHLQDFGNGFSGGVDYERVSDGNYFADLSTHIVTTSKVNMQQQAYLNYSGAGWNFNGLVQKYQTLDHASYVYQRLPQLTLTRSDDWGLAETNLYSQWVRFDRNDGAPAAVTGNRFTLYPSISLPLTRPYGYLTPKLGVRVSHYSLSDLPPGLEGGTQTLPIFSVDSGAYFDQELRVGQNQYTQTLEPRLFYVYIPYRDQNNLPNFDTGLADLNLSTIFSENQFSGNDRVNNANQITMAVTSRLVDSKTGEQRLSATLGQRFYFSDQKINGCPDLSDPLCSAPLRKGTNSDLLAAFNARLLNHWDIDGTFQYDTDQSQFMKRNIAARYTPEPGKAFNMAYRFTRDYLEQIDTSTEWPIGPRWIALGQVSYSLRENDRRLIEALGGVEYNAGCWQGRAVVQRISPAITSNSTKANYAFYFQIVLGGIGSIGTDPLDLLKRNIPGYVNSSWVPDTNH